MQICSEGIGLVVCEGTTTTFVISKFKPKLSLQFLPQTRNKGIAVKLRFGIRKIEGLIWDKEFQYIGYRKETGKCIDWCTKFIIILSQLEQFMRVQQQNI